MKQFHWETTGNGKVNLVLLHGWGLNSKIWYYVVNELKNFFKIYLIDLPGYGQNNHLNPLYIHDLIQLLHFYMPKNSIWLGWSMSGLIVSQLALNYPHDILGIITVSSSPYFIKKRKWPGLKKKVLQNFQNSLVSNYEFTIHNFLSSQMTGAKNRINSLEVLKKKIFLQPQPTQDVLEKNLEMLFSIDLRSDLAFLESPFLRIYGSLDALVPKKIMLILDEKWPKTCSIMIKKAAHIPFISHQNIFCANVLQFAKKILNLF